MLKVLSFILLLFSVSEFKGTLLLCPYSSCVKLIFSYVKITFINIYIYTYFKSPLLYSLSPSNLFIFRANAF